MTSNNYYHIRGIKVRDCVNLCRQLGLNPCFWNHLNVAFEILKVQTVKL